MDKFNNFAVRHCNGKKLGNNLGWFTWDIFLLHGNINFIYKIIFRVI